MGQEGNMNGVVVGPTHRKYMGDWLICHIITSYVCIYLFVNSFIYLSVHPIF